MDANPRAIIVASEDALKRPAFSPKELSAHTLELRPGQTYPRGALLERLAGGGYERVEMVEMEGESAIRGEVVDLWPPNAAKPWRLLFDGDTLESLREFSPGTQRSEAYLEPQKLLPMKETSQSGTLADFAPEGTIWFWDEVEPATSNEQRATRRIDPDSSLIAHRSLLYSGLPPANATDAGAKSTTGLASGVAMAAVEAKKQKPPAPVCSSSVTTPAKANVWLELLEEQIGSRGTEGMEFVTGPLRVGFFSDHAVRSQQRRNIRTLQTPPTAAQIQRRSSAARSPGFKDRRVRGA
jgi:transcription-repair coupling factor (superfamily II helicase)